MTKTLDFAEAWQRAPSGLVLVDEQGKIVQVNQTFYAWTGYTEKQLLNQPVSKIFTAESWLMYQGVLAFRLSSLGHVDEVHLNLLKEQKAFLPVLCSARYVDMNGSFFTALAMLPISRKDKLERELLEARHTAQIALAENQRVINELEVMRVKLESRNHELYHLTLKLGHEAKSDPLTDLPNRRYFSFALEDRLAQAGLNRHSDAFCVAMLDIDYFKPINDSHGHAVGDRVLKELAKLLASQMRGSDFVARIGGEEFAILMPETSLKEAFGALDRLRNSIELHQWEPVHVTCSIGVTGYLPEDTSDSLMARADLALYEAKRLGRNRVAKS